MMMSDNDPSKQEIISFFCDALTSFVNILDYVAEYVELHRDDGEFDDLLEQLGNFNDVYIKHIHRYEQELKNTGGILL